LVADDGPDASNTFERLYQAQYGSIYAYVRRRMASSLDVPDVVSEVFTVAWRRIDELPSSPQDRLWLFGVAHRCLLAHERQRWGHARLLSMLESQSNLIELVQAGSDALHFRVQSALESLRFKDREVLILVYWDGLTHADAAIVLGCSVNAVALRVKKAKARLQSKLSPLDVGEATRPSPPLLTPRKEHHP
jgi:RNA polymerase sigma factor (sigma-70 family)